MKKVLIITYYWPPGSGAGVQRWLKFSKYLPSFGWEPVVLTVDPDYAAYPALDNTILAEISGDLKVYKTKAIDYFRIYKKDKTKIPSAGFAGNDDKSLKGKILRFIRGNFFIPDPRKGWNNFAFMKACEIIENEGIKHIITTSPPHSTQLIGLRLKKSFPGIKWIADMRDPWTDIYYYNQFYHTLIPRLIDKNLERNVLNSADKIITVGKSLKDIFSSKIQGVEEKIEVITNGYDEDDFTGIIPVIPDLFTISYIGTLSDAYPVGGLLDALQNFKGKNNVFKIRFVGTVSPGQKDLIISKLGISYVEFVPYVDHVTAIKYMSEASVLLLIIPDHRSNKCIITGKLFEYLAARKPIVCLGPSDGDAADIIRSSGSGYVFDYKISAAEEFIRMLTQNQPVLRGKSISEYSRKTLASHLVEILEH